MVCTHSIVKWTSNQAWQSASALEKLITSSNIPPRMLVLGLLQLEPIYTRETM